MRIKKSKVRLLSLAALVLFLALLRRRGKVGTFLGMPYDLRLPTPRVVRERMWNPQDERIFTPHVLGWGWSVNFHALGRRLGLIGERKGDP